MAPQLAENSDIRFFVATQTLKPQNQVHLVEFNEGSSALKQRVSQNPIANVSLNNSFLMHLSV